MSPSVAALAADSSVPFIINGEDVHSERKFDVVSPGTGKVIHTAASASEADVRAAVNSAAAAFQDWKTALPKTRRDILLKAADVMLARNDELRDYMSAETGCPHQWSNRNLEIARDFIIDVAGRLTGLEGTMPTPENPDTGAMVLREPFGVILAIAPW